MVYSILDHYVSADAETRAAGRAWYPETFRLARRLAREHGTTRHRAAAVLAALSPLISWKHNVTCARMVLSGERPACLGASHRRALACLAARRPGDGMGDGLKLANFYRAIVGDPTAVTVDIWAAKVAGFDARPSTPGRYREIADAYREAAAAVQESPRDLQAITWCQIRGRAR